METVKPVQNLSETIHSLLGFKAHLSSAWVRSVCNIMKNVSFQEEASSPSAIKAENFQKGNSVGIKDDESVSSEVHNLEDELSALTICVNKLNIQRRQVLNDFLDLKGNIRVFCRIRPIRHWEISRRPESVVASDSTNVILKVAENKSKSYNFDKVFHPDSLQDEVFAEIEPVLKSVLDGYNACIFAYGQTGTGKTFTMEGTAEFPGIVPRAIEALFEQATESNHAFLISFSMLEIYLGNVRDLLASQPIRPTDPMPPCLSIHKDPKGGIEIQNLVAIEVSNFHQALKLYKLGCRYRSTASTNSNKESSRSHCMIRISITCYGEPERRQERNKLWLVDLGGSERVLKTKASGRRLGEGKAINLSLFALGDVINALQRKKHHIPYRNSKLTQVLQDSLGQDSKTLMLVHVSPKEEDLCETICSLNFATRAKRIHLGHEEPTAERERKEAALTNLQKKMKNIEEERQRVLRDIKMLNHKLENLTGRGQYSHQHEKETYLSAEETSEVTNSKSGAVRLPSSSSDFPSFMRATVSSRRKSGTDNQTLGRVFATRRRPPSHRAESVNFPVKKNSEYTSDRSISNTTCGIDLATKSNADNMTEYSQDISECDVKVVVCEFKKVSKRSSNQQRERFSNSTKISRIDNWLHLQNNQADKGIHSHRKKQVLTTPAPGKMLNSLKQWNKVKASLILKAGTNNFMSKNILSPKNINVEEIEEVKTEKVIDKPMVMQKEPFTEQILVFEEEIVVDKRESSLLYPSPASYDVFSQCTDDDEEHMVTIMEETNTEEWLRDRVLEDQSISQYSLHDVENSADSEGESLASILTLERASHCKQSFREAGKKDEEQENKTQSSQLSPKGRTTCLLKLKSQRSLFMDNGYTEQHDKLPAASENRTVDKGTVAIFRQILQTLCFCVLLGFGFLKPGYDHDFFHGSLQ